MTRKTKERKKLFPRYLHFLMLRVFAAPRAKLRELHFALYRLLVLAGIKITPLARLALKPY